MITAEQMIQPSPDYTELEGDDFEDATLEKKYQKSPALSMGGMGSDSGQADEDDENMVDQA